MTVFKCKMCGGSIEFEQGTSVGVCSSCGTKQTLPRLDDDRRANLYDHANHFRRNNEFDKASGIYEQILSEDNTDAEAYWSLVLCRYGIEYVEDPATHNRVPTVNRTQFTSVFDDDNYKSALKYADSRQRSLYEEEAGVINEIQKGILAISQKEEPFDVFICYKETDDSGRRTPDSVLANDLYYELTEEGFKVFFSRITLEDKLGTAYEPYIFAALNSSKVMVVLGTKAEYFNAPWVKNEWSRYLLQVKESGGKKVLIPAYKDMNPYDLPEEFSHLQSQDMTKLGFMQDLLRGIRKIVRPEKPKVGEQGPVIINSAGPGTEPLLKRAFIFLEDGNWQDADAYCERVLDQDPENAQAYLGKLLAELHIRRREDLSDYGQPLGDNDNYQKLVRFGGGQMDDVIRIHERNENARLTGIYDRAVAAMNAAETETAYENAAGIFDTILGFKDADSLVEQCLDKAEACHKDAFYAYAKSQMTGVAETGYSDAILFFKSIPGWRDADEQILVCQRKIEEIRANAEKERREAERAKRRKAAVKRLFGLVVFLGLVALLLSPLVIQERNRNEKRNEAKRLVESGNYEAGYKLFTELGDTESISSSKNERAKNLVGSGNYEAAYQLFREAGNTEAIVSSKYERAKKLLDSGDYEAAYRLFSELGDTESISSSKNERAKNLVGSGNYEAAYQLFKEAGNTEAIKADRYDRAMKFLDSKDYVAAYMLLDGINYKDSADKIKTIKPQYKKYLLSEAKAGSYVLFGSYEQDNNHSNGREDIEWQVLTKENNRILLISRYALESKPYNISDQKVSWETCSLREWLNGDFLDTAFSSEERKSIVSATVSADKNPAYSTSSGNNTTDEVFLLSIKEVLKYFDSSEEKVCIATSHAISQGASNKNGRCWWWLRTPGYGFDVDAIVLTDGTIIYSGYSITNNGGAVRPALWIKLSP